MQFRAKIIEKFRTARDMASEIESEAQKVGQMIHDLIDDINDYAIQYEEIGEWTMGLLSTYVKYYTSSSSFAQINVSTLDISLST